MSLFTRLFKNKRKAVVLDRLPEGVVVRAGAIAMALTHVPELRLLRTLVDKSRSAIDVGANRGVFTYSLSLRARMVYAYEPNPIMADRVRALGLPNVTVRDVALSSTAGTASLLIPFHDGVALDTRASFHLGDAEGTHVEVPLRRLDEEMVSDVGFIKIDVEGHERAVLEGAARLIARERPNILIEIEQRFLDHPIDEMFDVLHDFGYTGAYLSPRGLRPLSEFDVERDQLRYLPDVLHDDYVNNFIFKPLPLPDVSPAP